MKKSFIICTLILFLIFASSCQEPSSKTTMTEEQNYYSENEYENGYEDGYKQGKYDAEYEIGTTQHFADLEAEIRADGWSEGYDMGFDDGYYQASCKYEGLTPTTLPIISED